MKIRTFKSTPMEKIDELEHRLRLEFSMIDGPGPMSRFTVGTLERYNMRRPRLYNCEFNFGGGWGTRTGIALRQAKEYCGNHPVACERPHEGAHRRSRHLEGADWVEFNDRLNNICDALSIEARIESAVVLIRDGRRRCCDYLWHRGAFGSGLPQWSKIGEFSESHFGNPEPEWTPPPPGTPGYHVPLGYHVVG